MTYTGSLSGPAESPPNASPGTGTATVAYDPTFHSLKVTITFSGLTGATNGAHIHCCVAPPGNVGVATQTPAFAGFPLGVTSGSYNGLLDLTSPSSWNAPFISANGGTPAGAEAVLAAGLANGMAYLNLHTNTFAGGEIRSFLACPPDSTSPGVTPPADDGTIRQTLCQ
jgi:hypothetical protein